MKIRNNVKPTLPPIPGGTYLAICVYSIGIGEQLCEYEGKSKNYYNQVMLGFEICGQTIEVDGKQEPRVLSKTFNAVKGKKSGLRKQTGFELVEKPLRALAGVRKTVFFENKITSYFERTA